MQAERQRLARVSPIPAQLDPDAIIAGLEQVEPVTLGRERSVMAAVPGTSLPEEVVITRALPSEAGITQRSSSESLAQTHQYLGKHKGINIKAKATEDYYGKSLDEFFQFTTQSEILHRLRP